MAIAALALSGAGAARAEMVYRVATMGEPQTLDPHGVSGTWENYIVGDLFLGLTTEDAAAKPIPGAAESWTVSDDGLTYTFKLRDHQWSDGTPVTAEDFVYAWRRLMDPERAAEYAWILYPVKNAEALNKGELKNMEELGVKAIDDKTLEVTLKDPTPYFIELLAHYTTYPVPKHVVEKAGKDWVKPGTMVSNGPYMLQEWVPNSQVVSVKNPHFYDAANVKIDKVVYIPDEDRNAVTKRFRAGEIDVTDDFASEQIDWLKANLPKETRISPYLGIYYYPINHNREAFKDKRVREALTLAIDRAAITDKVLKTGELPAYSFVPPGTGSYGDPSYAAWKDVPYKERLAKAKELMKEAGYGPDKPLKLTISYNTSENHKKIAVAVAAMWKQIGVQAELFNSEVKVHYKTLESNNFDVARAAWIADYNDPQTFLALLKTGTGVQNYGRYSNPEYDRLMDESDKTRDEAKRNELMHQAEPIMLADFATIPIYYYVNKDLVSQKVEGWVDNTKNIHRARWLAIAD